MKGLALIKTQVWISVWILWSGSAAAQNSRAAEDVATAAPSQLAERIPKELGLELTPRCFRTGESARACTLEGDFDGDEKLDRAALVQRKGCGSGSSGRCQSVGIVFLLGNGKWEVLGAGQGRWRHVNEDTGKVGPASAVAASEFAVESENPWFWRVWRLTKQGPRALHGNGPHPSATPPGMRRDGIELSAGDASILIYRAAQGWIRYELGY